MEVLLVDDDADCAHIAMTAATMANVGFNINLVVDGIEAMDYLQKKERYMNALRPELILLDLELPRKSGREVLEEIREDKNLESIPVVIFSSTDRFEELKATYGLSNHSCRTKPAFLSDYVSIMKSIKERFLESRLN